MARRIILPRPDDFHVHLRSGERLNAYTRREAGFFGRALVMPNTLPPIVDASSITAYRSAILAASDASLTVMDAFEPLMTFKLLPGMTAAQVGECARAGAIAGKYYPAGATTNSADGISDPAQVAEALGTMEKLGLVLCIHGEDPNAPVLEREGAFLPAAEGLLARYPGLRIVLEHLSTRIALDFVLAGPDRLAGSLTSHHLLCSMDELLGESLDPHLFCKPVLKAAADRDALRAAAFGQVSPGQGGGRLFFGSDSAPHPRAAKEGPKPPAGIYSSPTALAALVSLFVESGAEAALRPFLCENGAAFYRLPPAQGSIALEESPWTVPDELDGCVPFLAGKTLPWGIAPSPAGSRP